MFIRLDVFTQRQPAGGTECASVYLEREMGDEPMTAFSVCNPCHRRNVFDEISDTTQYFVFFTIILHRGSGDEKVSHAPTLRLSSTMHTKSQL